MPDIDLTLPSKAKLVERARALLKHHDMSDMGHSEYDAAWLARVPRLGTQEPAFPEVLQMVRDTQARDGGWAPDVEYVSARLLATLSSILALSEFKPTSAKDQEQAERGAQFVRDNWSRLDQEPDLTIGFELVAASLIEEACERDFKLEAMRQRANDLHQDKMSRVPPELVYNPQFSVGFSLEFLRDKLDVEKARKLQALQDKKGRAQSGLVAASVATTAHFIRRSGEPFSRPDLDPNVRALAQAVSKAEAQAEALAVVLTKAKAEEEKLALAMLQAKALSRTLAQTEEASTKARELVLAVLQAQEDARARTEAVAHANKEALEQAEDEVSALVTQVAEAKEDAQAPARAEVLANVHARRGLRMLVAKHGLHNVPFGTGTGMWQRLWIAYHLHIAGLSAELKPELLHYLERLRPHLEEKNGLGWSMEIAYCDSDDTSVALGLLDDTQSLSNSGNPESLKKYWSMLEPFERKDGFVGFLYERGASVSANAHVLEAIQGRPYPKGQESADKAAHFLLGQRKAEGFWTDKWHASPYYVTSRATRALLRWMLKDPKAVETLRTQWKDDQVLRPSLQWLQTSQWADGGWGWFRRSSPEESAYALHALAAARLAGLSVDLEVIKKGLSYLAPFDGTEPDAIHPKLWIAKDLYRPIHVVRSTVLAAQYMCMRALGLEGHGELPIAKAG